jgi:cellobiose phosphorylase
MEENAKELIKNLIQLKIRPGPEETAQQLRQEEPLRAELFSVEQMAEFAKVLSLRHSLETTRTPDRLLPRLNENEELLLEAYQLLQSEAAKKNPLLPADEWFLDNFHLIEEQIRLNRKHLPKAYSRELPILASGKSQGFPRVYDMALEIVAHGDGRVDAGSLSAFVEAYQISIALKLGELWAIPIMLRLALIENLRRVAARITAGKLDRKLANTWADRMISVAEKDSKNLVLEMADMARSQPPMSSAFVAELTRRLQGQGPALGLPLNWIEQRLSEDGLNIEQQVRLENQRRAEDQVSVANSISSLRFIHAMDWRIFVETLSRVEAILSLDPAAVYDQSDFTTRDRCRHRVEFLARRSAWTEEAVASQVLNLARAAAASAGEDQRRTHVGYYLLDRGQASLEQLLKPRLTWAERFFHLLQANPLPVYLGAFGFFTLGMAGALLLTFRNAPDWFLGVAGVLAVAVASQPALGLVNWLAGLLVKPTRLPRLDYSHGLPAEARTLIVVPCMLSTPAIIADLLENLEVISLANRDGHLHFGLVTDFKDAPEKTLPGDEALLAGVRSGIENLNDRYPMESGDRFYLFHRPRQWNASQGCWMGWERKRGKLENLNTVLRDQAPEPGTLVVGDTTILHTVQFVITLDIDTQMTLDSARTLVATMAHPLNRARVDKAANRVNEGYGILQPRMGTAQSQARKSWFVRLFGGEEGIDPYTQAVSDTYQDIFGEGSFVGKGIYDVDVVRQVLSRRFPENRILSHDLLEGGYARSGLVSDVVLYENIPPDYLADVRRRHRWIRGDWQIARWLLPRVPGPAGLQRNPLRALDRWKIADNLRRSLMAPATLALLLCGWLNGSYSALITGAVALMFFLPPLLVAAIALDFQKPREQLFELHLRNTLADLARRECLTVIRLAFLPFEAYYTLGAIGRTLYRLWISRRRLLSWTPAGDATHATAPGFADLLKSMWIAPALALAAEILPGWKSFSVYGASGMFTGLWFAAPLLVWFLNHPPVPYAPSLSPEQAQFLRKLARRTWRFFETYVQEADHWLPLDNVQEQPVPARAHRTSPTNIGLSLLASLSAYDFGFITSGQLLLRTGRTLQTLESLERFRGHCFNWYDTQTLQPLEPRYISSVDSGNLAGHLLVLRQGLLTLPDQPLVPESLQTGRSDTWAIFEEMVNTTGFKLAPALKEAINHLRLIILEKPRTLAAHREQLMKMAEPLAALEKAFAAFPEAAWWLHALELQCRDLHEELEWLVPFLASPGPDLVSPANALPEKNHSETARESLLEKALAASTLRELANLDAALLSPAEPLTPAPGQAPQAESFKALVTLAAQRARERMAAVETLTKQCLNAADMEYDFLYDPDRHLLTIGYHVRDRRRDDGFYDLLASEARLGSFVAIAQGYLPQENWFSLGRTLTQVNGRPVLLSWGGSMFEYLMPQLVMPSYENTLLEQTCQTMVARQIAYGEQRGVFWGISESGYNATDANHYYQYRAFGVPGLGYKRGLSDDLVVAPYASALALMVAPEAAAENLQALAAAGMLGPYGLVEALDYTPARLPRGKNLAVVNSYMAHHQGMVLLSIAYCLLNRPMQKRFTAEPLFQAAALLLQERVPKISPAYSHAFETSERPRESGEEREALMRIFNTPHTPVPEVHLLSNGRYHVMVTAAGGGYSRWKDLALTRWREDATQDDYGLFCYIRDVERNETWSATFQPVKKTGKHYEAIFSQARAEFRRRDLDLDTHTEIAVSPEDDVELRRVRITNRSRSARVLELTSYAEVVLAPVADEATHPAFNNLFIQTEIVHNRNAVLCTRRSASARETPPWLLHLVVLQGAGEVTTSFETNRLKFIGRGLSVSEPAGLAPGPLSGSEGAVLDPMVAIRHRFTLEPEGTVVVNLILGAAETRENALGLIEKYHDWRFTDRVFELAFSHGQVVLHQLNASEADAQLFGRLASSVIFSNAARRAQPSVILKNTRGQSGLWGYGVSGDLPIVLLRISDPANIDLVRRMLQVHAYWRLKGLAVDLVIWNEDASGYRQLLHDRIIGLISSGLEAHAVDRPAGIFVRRMDQIPEEDQVLMQTVARVIITDRGGSLEDQILRRNQAELPVAAFAPNRRLRPWAEKNQEVTRRDLAFFNGLGGFTQDGKEYIVTTTHQQTTPMPWVNVLANPDFGTVISESGSAYTFSENAHEFRLTPWRNDPVSDAGGEALYIRDEESGRFWSPAPFPVRGAKPYACRHGFGYTIFEYVEHGIASELTLFVATDASVKFYVLKLHNVSGRARRLTATGYVEWVLGELRPKTFMHVVTEVDRQTQAIFARNPFNTEFASRVAFFDLHDSPRTFTGDRTEFIGRNGSLKNPAAMGRTRLSNKVGPALDPCAALQTALELAEGEEREIVFVLGSGRSPEEARALVQRFRGTGQVHAMLEGVWAYWNRTLGAVHLETPDRSLNLLANGWLLYQVIACRLWARSGYYQSGGAFGFRDQLQDVLALLYAEPGLLREHLLRAAGHQFPEGDVQHWWHPPQGRGVRTRISDDYLWLPYAVCRYVAGTGDTGVLDEKLNFVEGRLVKPEEESYYDLPGRSEEKATLYEHCVRAILHALRFGAHGLPLMGTGDWNDGMNRVGEEGKGESVWLAFFLYRVLRQFSLLALMRADTAMSDRCLAEAEKLRENLSQQAWDGHWWLRAFFDDGEPLGTAAAAECRIDSLPQSWSVLSGAGDPQRNRQAMQAVEQYLVKPEAGLLQLFDPPFDKPTHDPGYIRGYVPGVRENGGQYTHAAVWAVMAMAALGESQKAWGWLNLLNPISHTSTPAQTAVYKTEPYVLAGDVYAREPYTGQGGWTWYTGSAGWMYQGILESLLGLKLDVDKLTFSPCWPETWQTFQVHYRFRETVYHITVSRRDQPGAQVVVDGAEQGEPLLHLLDDRREHWVEFSCPTVKPPLPGQPQT